MADRFAASGRRWWIVAHGGLLALIAVLIVCENDYFTYTNDFWGNVWLAQRWDWSNPKTFYNGFHPIGYTVFLKPFATTALIRPFASLANVGFDFIALLGCGILAYELSRSVFWSLLAVSMLAIGHSFAEIALTQGADAGCTAFATVGILFFYFSFDARRRPSAALLSGALLGMAALWRYYGMALGLGMMLGSLILAHDRKHRTAAASFMVGFWVIYSAQILCNICSGHGPIETNASFNTYVLLHGVDWDHPPTPPKSLWSVIGERPARFAIFSLTYIMRFAAPLALIVRNLVSRSSAKQVEFRAAMSIACFATVVLLSVGASARGILPLVPYFVVELSSFIRDLCHRALVLLRHAPLAGAAALGVGGALLLAGLVLEMGRTAILLISMRRSAHEFAQVERFLLNEGISKASEVYTDDYDLYLPNLGSPRKNAGWLHYDPGPMGGVPPDLNTSTLDDLYRDCRKAGVKWLVVTAGDGRHNPAIARLNQQERGQDARFQFVDSVGRFKVFRVLATAP